MKQKLKQNWLLLALLLSLCLFSACDRSATEEKSDFTGETVKEFVLTVTDTEGNQTTHNITTAKETVGEALLEQGLIAGEEGPYGIYIKTVNGITLDYDKDGMYWAFYVNDEYAASGVDKTKIDENAIYALKAE